MKQFHNIFVGMVLFLGSIDPTIATVDLDTTGSTRSGLIRSTTKSGLRLSGFNAVKNKKFVSQVDFSTLNMMTIRLLKEIMRNVKGQNVTLRVPRKTPQGSGLDPYRFVPRYLRKILQTTLNCHIKRMTVNHDVFSGKTNKSLLRRMARGLKDLTITNELHRPSTMLVSTGTSPKAINKKWKFFLEKAIPGGIKMTQKFNLRVHLSAETITQILSSLRKTKFANLDLTVIDDVKNLEGFPDPRIEEMEKNETGIIGTLSKLEEIKISTFFDIQAVLQQHSLFLKELKVAEFLAALGVLGDTPSFNHKLFCNLLNTVRAQMLGWVPFIYFDDRWLLTMASKKGKDTFLECVNTIPQSDDKTALTKLLEETSKNYVEIITEMLSVNFLTPKQVPPYAKINDKNIQFDIESPHGEEAYAFYKDKISKLNFLSKTAEIYNQFCKKYSITFCDPEGSLYNSYIRKLGSFSRTLQQLSERGVKITQI